MAQGSFSLEILNTIRNQASLEYQERIPEATLDNLASIGRTFSQYNLQYNEFITNLFTRVGLSLINSKSFKNKLAKFKSGSIMDMKDVEEIWVDEFRTAEGTYDKEGGVGEGGIHPFKRRDPQEVTVFYHRMNYKAKYVVTIYKDDIIRCFNNVNLLDSYIAKQFNALYTGSEYDEWLMMKQLLASAVKNEDMFYYPVPTLKDADTAKTFIKTVKKAVSDLGYVDTRFNPAGVKTMSNPSELVLFIQKDIPITIDVDLYSQIFGPNYAKMNIEVIELDNFGDLTNDSNTCAILCDKDWFKVWDNKRELTQLYNPEGLYTNFWLHVWQTQSYSKFKNAVRFGFEDPATATTA